MKSLKLICGGRFGMFGGLGKPQDSVHRAWGDSGESWEGRNVNRIMRLQMVMRTVRNLMRCHWCCILANNFFTFCPSLKLRGLLSFKIVDWLLWWRTFMEPQRRDTWVRLTECHRQISYKRQKLTWFMVLKVLECDTRPTWGYQTVKGRRWACETGGKVRLI